MKTMILEGDYREMDNEYLDGDEIKNFIHNFMSDEMFEKYPIKSVEKTNLCYNGKSVLVPYIEFFIQDSIEEKDKETLKESFIAEYQKYFNTKLIPGIGFQNSGAWVREYNGKFFHLCAAEDSRDRNFVDYELFELSKAGYESILSSKYAYCKSKFDEKYIRRFDSKDVEYIEIFNCCLSQKLLLMLGL
jgi:hypothetical protein